MKRWVFSEGIFGNFSGKYLTWLSWITYLHNNLKGDFTNRGNWLIRIQNYDNETEVFWTNQCVDTIQYKQGNRKIKNNSSCFFLLNFLVSYFFSILKLWMLVCYFSYRHGLRFSPKEMERSEPSSGLLIPTMPIQLHAPPPLKIGPGNGAYSVRKRETVYTL